MQIEQLKPGIVLRGSIFSEPVKVLTVMPMGRSIKLIGQGLTTNQVHQPILTIEQLAELESTPEQELFNGNSDKFRHAVEAMPQCFENWCRRFDDVFSQQKQRQEFRVYLGGLLGESQRQNLSQMATNTVDSSYNSLRHFLNNAPWDESKLNNRRLEVMRSCRQTTPSKSFTPHNALSSL